MDAPHLASRAAPRAVAALGALLGGFPATGSLPAAAPYTYIHHPVSTDVSPAQFAFDRGLTLVLAYDSDEAELSFREAARLDPTLAMAFWGIALAVGPDINTQPDAKSTLVAADSLARARLLADRRATPEERAYIAALSARYSSEPKPDFDKLAIGYREAMRSLTMAHPDDADAAALYAEAIMDLHPWRLWTTDGNPLTADTPELVALLEAGLKRHPGHVGLLHFYIHAVEASSDPGRALDAAHRLAALPMEPAAAHLVHMPAHIFLRVGDWTAAIEANEHSVHHALDYRLSINPKQERTCGHCVDFLSYAYMMDGDEPHALQSSRDYQQLNRDPSNSVATLVRFHEWDDMLTFPEPAPDLKVSLRSVHAVRGLWHFGRGLALVAKGRPDRAEEELSALNAEAQLLPVPAPYGAALDVEHALDKLVQFGDVDTLRISAAILKARLAEARGEAAAALDLLREAVRIQDTTLYGEPPTWFYPVRESLGGLLLKRDAGAEAEAVFREGLARSPHDPRLLLGLAAALRARGQAAAATQAQSEYRAAWHGGDTPPAVTEF
jgi:hypothetical protein